MRPPEHYVNLAERALDKIGGAQHPSTKLLYATLAQVYATLALSSAYLAPVPILPIEEEGQVAYDPPN